MTRTAAALAWPAGLGVALLVVFGGAGFNPTDEGLVASASYRLLHGQIPHLDLIWPRPLGSAYLHIPELLLPTPLIMTGRTIALAAVIGYSLLLAWLILGRPPRQWGVGESVGVAGSALINLNTFPLMPWYTIDGLMFTAAGLVLLRSGMDGQREGRILLAFLLLGLAATTKQSFWPAPVLGLVWLVTRGGQGVRRHALLGVLVSALPSVVYAGFVAISGGAGHLVGQLTSGELVVGLEAWYPFAHPATAPLVLGLPVMLVLARYIGPEILGSRVEDRSRLTAWFHVGTAAALTALVMWLVLGQSLLVVGTWGKLLVWTAMTYVVCTAAMSRRIDSIGLLLVGTAWMTMLSWGLTTPNLVAGSVALYLVHRAWDRPVGLPSWLPRKRAWALVALLILVLPTFVSARSEQTYRDLPRAQLTVELGSIDPNLAGVRTNERTAAYLRGIAECVADHPARWVAVLPDNPALYAVFGWNNPLPIDFLYPLDYQGSQERLVVAAERLDASGDYLVLFQTVRVDDLAAGGAHDAPVNGSFAYDPELQERIREALSGAPVHCGVAEGVWSP